MTPEVLDIISVDHPVSCKERCKVMLRDWLKKDCSATWGTLVDAVNSVHVVPSSSVQGINILHSTAQLKCM